MVFITCGWVCKIWFALFEHYLIFFYFYFLFLEKLNYLNFHGVDYYAKQEPREEFSDWPQGLFSIGTFGNDDIKEITGSQKINNIQEENNPSSSEEVLDITPEEVGKLQKELTKLLSRKPNKEKEISELPLDRFLNCPSSLEVDRRISNALCCSESGNHDDHNYDKDDEDIDKTISVIIGKCKEVLISAERNKKAIGKKSISFLLKKMFVCRGGFAPAPSLRDTLQESRIEKVYSMFSEFMISFFFFSSISFFFFQKEKRSVLDLLN